MTDEPCQLNFVPLSLSQICCIVTSAGCMLLVHICHLICHSPFFFSVKYLLEFAWTISCIFGIATSLVAIQRKRDV